jgi:hypothetical protein
MPPPGQAQTPPVHATPAGHTLPHAPQFEALLSVSTQTPKQSTLIPPGHRHAPSMHWKPARHALPHAPQLSSSSSRFAQVPPQSRVPVGHTHAPDWQSCPARHSLPQAPQLVGSLARSTHPASPQSVSPSSVQPQEPSMQRTPDAHAVGHEPQCSASVSGSTQREPQRIWPGAQTQAPRTHVAPGPQAFPHAPQCSGSSSATGRPLHNRHSSVLPLQSSSMPFAHCSVVALDAHPQTRGA